MYLFLVEKSSGDTLHACSTFFYPQVLRSYDHVRKWTKNVDIFSKKIMLVPIHQHNNHWCLCVVSFTKKLITYYDSLGGTNQACMNVSIDYADYDNELITKNTNELIPMMYYFHRQFGSTWRRSINRRRTGHWDLVGRHYIWRYVKFCCIKLTNSAEVGVFILQDIPKQDNFYDCGVFMCTFAKYIARNAPLTFSVADIPGIRQTMMEEVVNLMLQAPSAAICLEQSPKGKPKEPSGTQAALVSWIDIHIT